MIKIESHKWWNADKTELVETGSPDAAFLAFAAGDQITDDEARRVGLLTANPAPKPSAPPPEPEPKLRSGRPANKLGARSSNKADDEETL